MIAAPDATIDAIHVRDIPGLPALVCGPEIVFEIVESHIARGSACTPGMCAYFIGFVDCAAAFMGADPDRCTQLKARLRAIESTLVRQPKEPT